MQNEVISDWKSNKSGIRRIVCRAMAMYFIWNFEIKTSVWHVDYSDVALLRQYRHETQQQVAYFVLLIWLYEILLYAQWYNNRLHFRDKRNIHLLHSKCYQLFVVWPKANAFISCSYFESSKRISHIYFWTDSMKFRKFPCSQTEKNSVHWVFNSQAKPCTPLTLTNTERINKNIDKSWNDFFVVETAYIEVVADTMSVIHFELPFAQRIACITQIQSNRRSLDDLIDCLFVQSICYSSSKNVAVISRSEIQNINIELIGGHMPVSLYLEMFHTNIVILNCSDSNGNESVCYKNVWLILFHYQISSSIIKACDNFFSTNIYIFFVDSTLHTASHTDRICVFFFFLVRSMCYLTFMR